MRLPPCRLQLRRYWFPLGTARRLAWSELSRVEASTARLLASKQWGAGADLRIWWHFDGWRVRAGRPCLVFERTGAWWRAGCTPKGGRPAVERMLAIVRSHVNEDCIVVDKP